MNTENLERAYSVARSVVANVKGDQLDDPTPCASWHVRDLLNHMIGGTFWAATAVKNGNSDVVESLTTDYTDRNLAAAYDEGIERSVAAFAAGQDGVVTLPFATLAVPAFQGIITTDAFVHAWDLARATGQPTDLDPELAAQLLEVARVMIQPAFRGDDGKAPFGVEQPAPPNASKGDELVAFLGRTV